MCPNCGSPRVARIQYGLIAPDEELKRKIHAGEVILGGCVCEVGLDWKCMQCGVDIYREGCFDG